MATERINHFIATSLWGACLTAEQLARVQRDTSELHVSAGETIGLQGLRAEYWYGVEDGLVKVCNVFINGKPTTLIGIPPGGWFGEGSVLKNEIRPYDVVAIRESYLALVPASTFHWLLEVSLPFNRFLINQLNARLAQSVIRVEHLRSKHPERHIAHCIAELFMVELYPKTSTSLQISQGEIALLAGLSRQLVNRTLQRLELEGLLKVTYGSLTITDVDGLRHFASSAD
jgi:CRP/FNR family transcriptional regulator, cyclic AMP receptor protein